MPIYEVPPFETLPNARDRWTPVYLEHGRLEVDDSSIKWIQADGLVCTIPVAVVSAIMLGPGTSVTHAAIVACGNSKTDIMWVSQGALRFHTWGTNTSSDNSNARLQAKIYGNRNTRTTVARRMFSLRFSEDDAIKDKTINELRGMEGIRWRRLYKELAIKYKVPWTNRSYDINDWDSGDDINKSISTANASLHSLCNSIICGMGYLPQIGFLHDSSAISFACDIADIFKAETTLTAAFKVVGSCQYNSGELEEKVLEQLKLEYEIQQICKKIPKAIEFIFKDIL